MADRQFGRGMTEDQNRLLEIQIWTIANTLRGKMHADEFRDDILGLIFFKYRSSAEEIATFNGTDVGLQDLAVSAWIVEAARGVAIEVVV